MGEIARRLFAHEGMRLEYRKNGSGQYSFDGGKKWFDTMAKAYSDAEECGKLVPWDGPQAAGEYEAFVMSLLVEIQGLAPGETLEVTRTDDSIALTKRNVVGFVRASAVEDIDLSVVEEDKS